MAYSDTQYELGRRKENNLDLLYSQIPPVKGDLIAQGMSDEEKFKKKKELKKQVRKTPKQRQSAARAKDPKFQGGSPGTVFVPEEFVPDPTAEEIQEALQDEDMREGNFLPDPESINRILQIGGAAAGSLLRFFNPFGGRALASTPQDGRAPTRLFFNPPYDNPKMFIKDKQIIDDAKERFKWNTGINLAGAPYSLNPQRIMLPNGVMEYAPLNLRSDDQKERQHMMIYGGKWNKPIT